MLFLLFLEYEVQKDNLGKRDAYSGCCHVPRSKMPSVWIAYANTAFMGCELVNSTKRLLIL